MSLPNLHASHRALTLRSAMAMAYKTKNFIAASFIARRFLQLTDANPELVEEDVKTQAQKILTASERKGTNEYQLNGLDEQLFYDERSKIDLCDFSVLSRADSVKQCPFDKATFKATFAGRLCPVCLTSEIGKSTVGLKIVR